MRSCAVLRGSMLFSGSSKGWEQILVVLLARWNRIEWEESRPSVQGERKEANRYLTNFRIPTLIKVLGYLFTRGQPC